MCREKAPTANPCGTRVIGYGNTGVAAISEPPLTTTQIEMHQLGIIAMNTLEWRMRHPREKEVVTLQVSSYLIERESVADLRG